PIEADTGGDAPEHAAQHRVERGGALPDPVGARAQAAPTPAPCATASAQGEQLRETGTAAVHRCGKPRASLTSRGPSGQDDVVDGLAVGRLDLQRDRLADGVAQRRERLAFLFEEQVDHFLRREDAELAGIELPRLALDLAQDLVADRAGRLDLAHAMADRAGFAEQV